MALRIITLDKYKRQFQLHITKCFLKKMVVPLILKQQFSNVAKTCRNQLL